MDQQGSEFNCQRDYYDQVGRVEVEFWAREYQAARQAVENGHEALELITAGFAEQLIGESCLLEGKLPAAKAAWQQAIVLLDQAAKEKENYAWPYICKSISLAGLGERDAAQEACRKAQEILPVPRDKVHGGYFAAYCVLVAARLGDRDQALIELEKLIRIEREINGINSVRLRLHPEWDFFRDDPRFRALYEQPATD